MKDMIPVNTILMIVIIYIASEAVFVKDQSLIEKPRAYTEVPHTLNRYSAEAFFQQAIDDKSVIHIVYQAGGMNGVVSSPDDVKSDEIIPDGLKYTVAKVDKDYWRSLNDKERSDFVELLYWLKEHRKKDWNMYGRKSGINCIVIDQESVPQHPFQHKLASYYSDGDFLYIKKD